MATVTQSRNAKRLQLFALCVVLFPLTVVAHELAHWLAGRAAGFSTQLHFASVSGLPEQPPFAGAPAGVAIAALAGPALTLLVMALGMANARSAWGAALVASALARFAVNLIYMIQQILVVAGIAEASQPNFDEVLAGRALGVPPQPLAAVGAVALVGGIIWLWRRLGGVGFLVVAVGTGIGLFGWMALLGPRLLP